jgi:hypothetical protein
MGQMTSQFFVIRFYAHLAWEDAHTTFYLESFDISKYVENNKKMSICIREPKHHSCFLILFMGYISAFGWLITVVLLTSLKIMLCIGYIAFLGTFRILAVFMVTSIL